MKQSVAALFSLSDKKAIITGAGGGLGKEIAAGLLEAGADIVLIDSSSHLEDTASELALLGGSVFTVRGNLADSIERENLFNKAVHKLGGTLDILVNCAGIQRRNPSEIFSLEDWQAVIDINLTAVFSLCQLAGRIMLDKGEGKIINMASMLSFFGGLTVPAYAASKGGVAQLTKALSNEWASRGINVNAIAPGYMATEMNTALIHDADRNEKILARIPAHRWGEPEDLKGIAIFLSSAASDYVNGSVIPVDGGYLGY
ncbi:MAG: SDR family oxidoreductase [Saccharofermentanales bacterium]